MTLQGSSRSTEVFLCLNTLQEIKKERLYSDFTLKHYISKLDAYISSSQPFSACGTVGTFDMSQGKRINIQD
jgi:hypothetical protein